MSATLTDELYTRLQGEPLRQMSQQLGIGPAQMAGALSAALPMLLGVLGQALPRAVMPEIDLHSPKFTRKLTTQWFATRVEQRYRQCVAKAFAGKS